MPMNCEVACRLVAASVIVIPTGVEESVAVAFWLSLFVREQ